MDTNETEIFRIIAIACLLLILSVGLFIMVTLRHQKKIRQLNASKFAAEIGLLEAERNRIASDLHDELGPSMASIKNSLECIEDPGERNMVFLQQASDYIDLCISMVRKKTALLMPVILLKKGIVPAIEAFLEKVNKGSIHIHWQHHAIPAIGDDKSLHIFRAVQEITYNTIKHARASNLYLTMAFYQGKLMIDSEDDGIGFDGQQPAWNGMGLVILQKRIGLLNGIINVMSQPGKGTHIIIEVPLS